MSPKENSSNDSHKEISVVIQLSVSRVPSEANWRRLAFRETFPSNWQICSSNQLVSIETFSNNESSSRSDSRFERDLAPTCESLESWSVVRLRLDRRGNDNASHLIGPAFREGSNEATGRYAKLVKRGLQRANV
jgi:hypothetical protein